MEAAERWYDEALAQAIRLEMRPLQAHCHHGLGVLHERTGKPAAAGEHLGVAAALYREMGMRYWSERMAAGAGRDLHRGATS